MTIEQEYNPEKYEGNGVTTDFGFNWNAVAVEYIQVVLENNETGEQTVQELGVDYTATITDNNGIVSFNIAPSGGFNVIISRSVTLTQEVSYSQNNSYRGTSHENSFDKVVAQNQQQAEELGRSAKLPLGSTIAELTLPKPESRKSLVWKQDETGLENSSIDIDETEQLRDETKVLRDETEVFRDETEEAKNIAVAAASDVVVKPILVFTGDNVETEFTLTTLGDVSDNVNAYQVFVDGLPIRNGVDFTILRTNDIIKLVFLTFIPQARPENILVYGKESTLIEVPTQLPDFLEVAETGDDKGLRIVDGGQFSVGTPEIGAETTLGGGDSYPVGMENKKSGEQPELGSAWHCDISNTAGLTITIATDITEDLSSDNLSTIGLFGGNTTGKYILVGSDYPFGGTKSKMDTLGSVEPDNVIAEYLKDSLPTWITSPYMVTDAEFPYEQKANRLSSCSSCSEQWRFGFDRDDLPTLWDKVTLNINGTNYTKHWARFRITSDITLDPIIEQLKLHTNRTEINSDGVIEYFSRARSPRTLFFGVQNLINNTVGSPSNQDVTYETGETIADYNDNQFNDGVEDSALITQAIPIGLDTSIPLYLDISYYVEGIATGDIELQADVYKVTDGFVYDGSAIPDNYSVISQVITPSNLERKTATIKIMVNELTDKDSILIKLKRDATVGNTNDTLPDDIVVTQIKLTGYFWRL